VPFLGVGNVKVRIPLLVALLFASTHAPGLVPAHGQETSASLVASQRHSEAELVVLDFFANQSADCDALRPAVAKAEQRYGRRVWVVHVNVDNHKNKPFVEKVGVQEVPTLIVVNRAGDQLKTLVGPDQGSVLAILLETLLPSPGQAEAVADDPAPISAGAVVLRTEEAKLDLN
jgi:thioredoxin-like negative regulator of GroEL